MKVVIKIVSFAFAAFVAVNVLVLLVIAFPGWAFAHEGGTDRLRIHATEPVPDAAADWANGVMAALDASDLPPGAGPFHIYVTGDTWRETVFFTNVQRAGGVVYPFAKSHLFLSGADFEADRLIKGDTVIIPPRTLTYYAMHEITHLTHLARAGAIGYLRTPVWIREGVPDYIALGPAQDEVVRDIARAGDLLELMKAHGAYPNHRLAVTRALETRSIDDLLSNPTAE